MEKTRVAHNFAGAFSSRGGAAPADAGALAGWFDATSTSGADMRMMTILAGLLIGVSLVAYIEGARGSGGGEVGYLSEPTNSPAHVDSGNYPPPPLASESDLGMTCGEVQQASHLPLRYLPDAPPEMDAVCYIEGPRPLPPAGQDGAAPRWVHVLYVPDGIDLKSAAYEDVLDQGGLNISLHFTNREARPPEKGDPDSASGGYKPVHVEGEPGVVQRVKPNRVFVEWVTGSRAASDRPGRVGINLRGDYSPDEIVAFARELKVGIPPKERPPLKGSPYPHSYDEEGTVVVAPNGHVD